MLLKKLRFSLSEQNIIDELQRAFGITEKEATEHVICQKRELAWYQLHYGNVDLGKQLFIELDEWDDEKEKIFKEMKEKLENYHNDNKKNHDTGDKKIIIAKK